MLIEPRRSALIPGFAAVKHAALEAGALGASISGAGPERVRVVRRRCRSRHRDARARCARHSPASGFDSDAWISPVAGPAGRGHRMRYLSTRGGTLPEPLGVALAAGLAPDGGLFVPEALPLFRTDAFSGRETLPTLAAGLLDPFFRRRRAGAMQLPAISAESLDIPVPCARSRREAGCSSSFMVRPPHSRISARAFSLRALRALPPPGRASAHGAGRDFGRHRCRRRSGVSPACRISRRHSVSRRPRLAAPGTSARLLRRQRACAARRRARSTTARRWSSARSAIPAQARAAADIGQQHQPRSSAAADHLLRSCGARALARAWTAPQFRDSDRQSWQCTRLRLRARDRPPDRRHRARDQREPRAAGLFRRRRLHHRGRASRRSPTRWTSARRAISSDCAGSTRTTLRCARRISRRKPSTTTKSATEIRTSQQPLRTLVCPHTATATRVLARLRARGDTRDYRRRRDRASGQVRARSSSR